MSELELDDIAVNLGGRRVLSDVTCRIEAGEFVGLVGPNGAGKTTLLRAILGLVKTASGQVRVAGKTGAAATRQIGYVPQRHEFAWDYPISIEDVVMSGRIREIGWLRRPRRADHKAVHKALQRVELAELAERTVGELSGGQRQRVLIARALAAQATVLLLDEPFTGVDMPTQDLLTELFRQLADEGTTVIMTTHDLAGALATCDRIALINRTIVAQGTPAELDDADVWMDVFGVSATSPLLATVRAACSVWTSSQKDNIAC